ncbi:hypothetical protein REPUB_Repub11eG0013500 [Reevesia pubescens]
MEAPIGNNPSFTWRSICEGREVLKLGIRWRIGSGSQVRAMVDPWIPRPWRFRPVSATEFIPSETKVNSFFSHDNQQWNKELIYHLFPFDEATEILKIPLIDTSANDLLSWHWNHHGLYTVRSGYKALVEFRNQNGTYTSLSTSTGDASSGNSAYDSLWKSLWSLTIPNKIKVFGWRACCNMIPTLVNLKKKKISSEEMCFLCSRDTETAIHVLRDCNFAMEVWRHSNLEMDASWSISNNVREWFFQFLERSGKETFGLFLMLSWSIWSLRNNILHGGQWQEPSTLVQRSIFLLEEYRKATVVPKGGACNEPAQFQWSPPKEGIAKINFDGAVFQDMGSVGIGVAIRNHKGEVLALLAAKKQSYAEAFLAECIALREALLFALEIGFREVEVEGDSLLTICAVKNNAEDLENHSFAGAIIEFIKKLLPSFRSYKLKHVKRAGNEVANALAHYAKSVNTFVVWLEDHPSFLSSFLQRDADPFVNNVFCS